MDIETNQHVLIDGERWKEYTLKNDRGMEVSVLNYGGIITKILIPDIDGKLENVVASYKDYQEYLENPNFFGALIGRVAGRIKGAAFELDGKTYRLKANEGENHLHGGDNGFHQVIWNASPFQTDGEAGLRLTHHSPHNENGYPGELNVTVIYTLTNDNALTISYEATPTRKTALTLTNHSYFNLSGDLKTDVRNHHVTIASSQFVELDENLIPTGKKLDVAGTAFDFRNGRNIEDGIQSSDQQNINAGGGYDHYFIFDGRHKEEIIVEEPESKRRLAVHTDQPGVVIYTSNKLNSNLELRERKSAPYLGICLETQSSPASLHHDGFPSCIAEANETYRKQTTFTFGLMDS